MISTNGQLHSDQFRLADPLGQGWFRRINPFDYHNNIDIDKKNHW